MPDLRFLHDRLRRVRDDHAIRILKSYRHDGIHLIDQQDRRLVNFAANDYLGFAAENYFAARDSPTGSGASLLVTGMTADHTELSQRLAQFKSTESAVLFPSGYAACSGTIAALAGPNDLILSDALNHASLIDGCRIAAAEKMIYPHRDVATVASLLAKHRSRFRRVWIVTDSVFSMDGTIAPLPGLCDLANQYDALMVVDEAHATGVLGKDRSGATAALNVKQHVAIRIGTLSKAIGAHGGFVAGPEVLIEYLINFCRPLIFSTAGSPQTIAAANHHLGRIMKDATLTRRVHANTKRLRESIRKLHQNVETVNDAVENAMRRDGKAPFDSVPRDSIAYWESVVPIVPVILGDNQRAVDASRRLADAGYHVPAIRPPTVPENTSRLRISVSAAHSESQIRGLAKQLCGREIR